MTADARRFVRVTRERYDLIVSDNFHPARSGSGCSTPSSISRPCKTGLPRPVLPPVALHQLDLETLRSIVRTFLTVFPHGWAMLATNSLDTPVLVWLRRDGERFDIGQVRERLTNVAMTHGPGEFGIADESRVAGSSSPVRAHWRVSPATRRLTPTTIRWSPISRRASPMFPIPCREIG